MGFQKRPDFLNHGPPVDHQFFGKHLARDEATRRSRWPMVVSTRWECVAIVSSSLLLMSTLASKPGLRHTARHFAMIAAMAREVRQQSTGIGSMPSVVMAISPVLTRARVAWFGPRTS